MPRGNNVPLPLELYLNLVFPWDDPEDHRLYKAVTWQSTDPTGKVVWANYAAADYDGLCRLILGRVNRPGTNVYVALGTQLIADLSKMTIDGFPKANRKLPNMVSSRAIYLDVDVKAGAYATTADAKAAVQAFAKAVGLPVPSITMLSGSGGMHVYWCDHHPIPIADWKKYAEALRDAAMAFGLYIDGGVTVNAAGILRVPGSFNHKKNPPTQVMFDRSYSTFGRYDVASYAPALIAYAAQHGRQQAANPMGAAGTGGKTKYTQNFTANVGGAAPTPSVDELGACCPLIAQTLATAGAGQREPLWNLMMLAAAFTDDPTDAAHRLSSGHAGYNPADTDKKLTEKSLARGSNQAIGWPKCASFDAERDPTVPSICQTCPHFQHAKSPFNFVTQKQAQQAQAAALASATPWLPKGYWLDANGHVWGSIEGRENTSYDAEIIAYPVHTAGIDEDTEDLVFQATVAGAVRTCKINVSTATTEATAASSLAAQRIYIRPATLFKPARNFLMNWVSHLQDIKQSTNQSRLGWTEDCTGFTFDKTTYVPGGQKFAYTKFEDNNYKLKGDIKPWQDAMQLVYGIPELEATVASAFAAPLIELYGSTPVIMSIFSPESGCGKSTALKLGQTVWGNPSSMLSLTDTNNAFMHKISNMRSLPCYWDELRTHKEMDKCAELIFIVAQGKSKARLNRVIQLNEANSFKTMFVVASNYGLNEAIYSQTVGTEAGGLRVFELQVMPIVNSKFSTFQSVQLMSKLDHSNYGNAGVAFIQYVVANRDAVIKAIGHVAEKIAADHKLETKERFWAATMATIIVGATVANKCGIARFNITAITACLTEALEQARQNMVKQAYRTIARPDAIEGVWSEMLASARQKNLVVTETIPTGKQGVKAPPILLMVHPLDTMRLENPWIWQGDKDGRFIIRATEFDKYMRENNLSPEEVRRQLSKTYDIEYGKRRMFTSVQGMDHWANFRPYCYDFTPKAGPSPETSPGSSEPTQPAD